MRKFKVATIFGIRPDFIRASIILKKLINHPLIDLDFIYTGQHYDEMLKGVFFKELNIPEPTFVLDTAHESSVQQHALLISKLEEVLLKIKPDVCVFLGDANAVVGCIAPLKMGIPIAHIEAGMRSYDWSMPEERNRVIIDRISDVLYCYQHDYKYRLIQEGICPDKIVVTGNTIVDVLNEYEPQIDSRSDSVLNKFGVKKGKYAVMTLHRDAVMNSPMWAADILMDVDEWARDNEMSVILPTMPRLRELMKTEEFNKRFVLYGTRKILGNIDFVEPLGFLDFVALEKNAAIEFTDSGTNQETSSILGVPCVVLRGSTERPETFNSNISVMTNARYSIYRAANYVAKREKNPNYSLGDGNTADIIINDLIDRLKNKFYRISPPINNFMAKNWSSFENKLHSLHT